jgi:hypothetical protein
VVDFARWIVERPVMEADAPSTTGKVLPIEIYGEKRIAEFDAAEAELAKFLSRKK